MTQMKWFLVVEHDNGIRGQHGWSDGYYKTKKDAEAEIDKMKENGIVVYGYSIAKGE